MSTSIAIALLLAACVLGGVSARRTIREIYGGTEGSALRAARLFYVSAALAVAALLVLTTSN